MLVAPQDYLRHRVNAGGGAENGARDGAVKPLMATASTKGAAAKTTTQKAPEPVRPGLAPTGAPSNPTNR